MGLYTLGETGALCRAPACNCNLNPHLVSERCVMDYRELTFAATLMGQRSALPPFLGPTLRGIFGYLLKDVVCQISHGRCEACLLRTACP